MNPDWLGNTRAFVAHVAGELGLRDDVSADSPLELDSLQLYELAMVLQEAEIDVPRDGIRGSMTWHTLFTLCTGGMGGSEHA